MSLECHSSNLGSDVRCAVCGQGFLIYGDRCLSRERQAVRQTVQQVLREHHQSSDHPADGFIVDWQHQD